MALRPLRPLRPAAADYSAAYRVTAYYRPMYHSYIPVPSSARSTDGRPLPHAATEESMDSLPGARLSSPRTYVVCDTLLVEWRAMADL